MTLTKGEANMSTATKSKRGFTLIEMIMVMLVVSIMAAIAIPQFINYKTEAKDAKTQMYLGAIRSGIANQQAQMMLRCAAASGAWPALTDLNANDINTTTCTGAAPQTVVSAAEAKFITDPGLPIMPWGVSATVVECSALGTCVRGTGGCKAVGYFDQWCYNAATGDFWADSAGKTAF